MRLRALMVGPKVQCSHDSDDCEVITGCHQNRTLVPQPVKTLVYVFSAG